MFDLNKQCDDILIDSRTQASRDAIQEAARLGASKLAIMERAKNAGATGLLLLAYEAAAERAVKEVRRGN